MITPTHVSQHYITRHVMAVLCCGGKLVSPHLSLIVMLSPHVNTEHINTDSIFVLTLYVLWALQGIYKHEGRKYRIV